MTPTLLTGSRTAKDCQTVGATGDARISLRTIASARDYAARLPPKESGRLEWERVIAALFAAAQSSDSLESATVRLEAALGVHAPRSLRRNRA